MNMDALETASARVRQAMPNARPRLAVVLGSGWGEVADSFQRLRSLDYSSIPEIGVPQVPGHAGRVTLCAHGETHLLIFVGRRHWYEAAGWAPIAFPVHLARTLGATSILLTNSAGGINPALRAGTLMAIEDHINMMGVNPLAGPRSSFWGPRFPDMSQVYDAGLRAALDAAAGRAGVELSRGVYLAVTGPSYETPAEIRAFRSLGADAVGMSTVPEAILAHAAGLRVAGLSCITNMAAGLATHLSHEEVLASAKAAMPGMTKVIREFVEGL